MRNYFIIIAFIFFTVSCSNKKGDISKTVRNFYSGFKTSNFNEVKKTIDDSLIITEGKYTMSFNQQSFYEHFKWDSIFMPSYKITDLNKQGNQVHTTISVSSSRFKFLKNNPLVSKHIFSFNNGKISKIENTDFINANWNLWEQERDSLVKWIKINHPYLDGFIHDLTMKGALNYLKAIELYQKEH